MLLFKFSKLFTNGVVSFGLLVFEENRHFISFISFFKGTRESTHYFLQINWRGFDKKTNRHVWYELREMDELLFLRRTRKVPLLLPLKRISPSHHKCWPYLTFYLYSSSHIKKKIHYKNIYKQIRHKILSSQISSYRDKSCSRRQSRHTVLYSS